jgi:uncharacterized membrane protein YeaQ/YmgE (transglycosylase-associated protein family)
MLSGREERKMSRQSQIGLVLTVMAALIGGGGGFYLGLRLGEASNNTVGPVIIDATPGSYWGQRCSSGPACVFLATLLGSPLGVGIVLLSFRLFMHGAAGIGWLLIFACGLAGAVVGHHLSEQSRARGRLSAAS